MRAVGLGLALALMLSACTSHQITGAPKPTPSSAPPAAAPHLAVTVLQQRVDATTRMVGINTTSHEKAPVHVAAVRLSGAGLDGPATQVDADLQPGLTVALRTSYGRPHCDDRGGVLTAHLKIGGAWIDYAVNKAGQREVRRLLDTDCAAIHLAQAATVKLAGPYRTVIANRTPYLRGRLLMVRRSNGAAVDLRSMAGTVLVDLRPVRQLVDLAANADRAVTPVLLGSTGRCDPHGLGQSTQTFLLSAYVRLAGAPTQRVVLIPRRSVQGRVLHVISKACGTS